MAAKEDLKFIVETPAGSKQIIGSELNTLNGYEYLHIWLYRDAIDNFIDTDVVIVYNDKNDVRKTYGHLVKSTYEGKDVGLNQAIFKVCNLSGDVENVVGSELKNIPVTSYIHVLMSFDRDRLIDLIDQDMYLVCDDDGVTKKVSATDLVEVIPPVTIGNVTVSGDTSVDYNNTYRYTATYDGEVNEEDVTYHWYGSGVTIENEGPTALITFDTPNTITTIKCSISSTEATDSPSEGILDVTVNSYTIPLIGITGPTGSNVGDTDNFSIKTYSLLPGDVEYHWYITGTADGVIFDSDKYTCRIQWIKEGPCEVNVVVTSKSSTNSPRSANHTVSVLNIISIGTVTIDGNRNVDYDSYETYDLVVHSNGNSTDNVYEWIVTGGTPSSTKDSRIIVHWDTLDTNARLECIVTSESATTSKSERTYTDINISRQADLVGIKGTIQTETTNNPLPGEGLIAVDFGYENQIGQVTETYQWYSGNTYLASGQSYIVGPKLHGLTVHVRYFVSDETGDSVRVDSDPVTIDFRPLVLDPGVVAGIPMIDQFLFISGKKSFGGKDPYSYSYAWKQQGSNSVLSTSDQYIPVTSDIGKRLICTVTVTDDRGTSVSEDTDPSRVIETLTLNLNPGIVRGTPKSGKQVIVRDTSATGGTAPYVYTYQWYRTDGENDTSGVIGTLQNYQLTDDDVDSRIRCQVTATDANNYTGTGSTPSIGPIANADPAALNVYPGTFNADVSIGDTIVQSDAGYDGGTPPVDISYQWEYLYSGTIIGTSKNYLVKQSDVGQRLRCKVTAADSAGQIVSKYTTSSNPILDTFKITSFDDITVNSGGLVSRLVAGNYTVSGNQSTVSERYQWYMDGVLVQDSFRNYYQIEEYCGKNFSVLVTLTEDDGGRSANAMSNDFFEDCVVIPPPDVPDIDINIDVSAGNIRYYQTSIDNQGNAIDVPHTKPISLEKISIVNSSYVGPPGGVYSYKWFTEAGQLVSESKEFYLSPLNIGDKLYCEVTVTYNKHTGSNNSAISLPIEAHKLAHTGGHLISDPPLYPGDNLSVGGYTIEGGEEPYNIKWRWYNNLNELVGEDTHDYKVKATDVGRKLRRQTTVSDKWGIESILNSDNATGENDYTQFSEIVQIPENNQGGSNDIIKSFGKWQSDFTDVSQKAIFTPSSWSVGPDETKYVNQFGLAEGQLALGNVTPQSTLSQRILTNNEMRSLVTGEGGNDKIVSFSSNQCLAFDVNHNMGLVGSLYRHQREEFGPYIYTYDPKGFTFRFRIERYGGGSFNTNFTVRNISKDLTMTFNVAGPVDLHWATPSADDFKTRIEITAGGSGVTYHMLGIYPITWSSYLHGNGSTSSWPKTYYYKPNSWIGFNHYGIDFEKYYRITDDPWNDKLPEGVWGMLTSENMTYHDITTTNGNHETKIFRNGDSSLSVRNRIAANMEYSRYGVTYG